MGRRFLIMSDASAERLCATLRKSIATLENEVIDPSLTEFGRWTIRGQIEDLRGALVDMQDKPATEPGAPA